MSNQEGFWIENLDEMESLLKHAADNLPDTIKNLLESLGEELLNLAKLNMRAEKFPHAVFKKSQNRIKQGKNKGKNRISIQYSGSENRNMIDNGGLWNSLQRGGRDGVWTFNRGSGTFRLKVGSNLKYAKYIHEGYSIKHKHWVPGVVDSNGIFRYKKGASSGIMAQPRVFKGIPFFEIALKDLEKIAPDIVKAELRRMFGGLAR